jgi:hypothetical protein
MHCRREFLQGTTRTSCLKLIFLQASYPNKRFPGETDSPKCVLKGKIKISSHHFLNFLKTGHLDAHGGLQTTKGSSISLRNFLNTEA